LKIKQLQNVESAIKKLESSQITVLEHAKLRYIERALFINTRQIYDQILTAKVREMIETLGDGTYPIGDPGIKIKVKNNVVVTVLTAGPEEETATFLRMRSACLLIILRKKDGTISSSKSFIC
jgi:hypothetical protein